MCNTFRISLLDNCAIGLCEKSERNLKLGTPLLQALFQQPYGWIFYLCCAVQPPTPSLTITVTIILTTNSVTNTLVVFRNPRQPEHVATKDSYPYLLRSLQTILIAKTRCSLILRIKLLQKAEIIVMLKATRSRNRILRDYVRLNSKFYHCY
ncbi:uncharacterized protein LOC125386742 [Bombus terrestris]|uniref:Uncharacterized protein LOC125386742 n=1 Tax=Bombus terrestris TaxID=30195 RepID=A0A9C6SZ56_BOMTE|nr:uncharacterized protein LOC125386742 [Bombus terrestris]